MGSARTARKFSKTSRNGASTPSASRYLSQYNEYLKIILDHVEDLIVVIDLKGKRLYNSPSYQAVLGHSQHLVRFIRMLVGASRKSFKKRFVLV